MAERTPNNLVSDGRWTIGNVNLPPNFQPPPYHHAVNFANKPPPSNFVPACSSSNFDTKNLEHQKFNAMMCQPYNTDANVLEANQFQNSKQQNIFNPLPSISHNSSNQNIGILNQVDSLSMLNPYYPKTVCQPLITKNDKTFFLDPQVPNFNSSLPNNTGQASVPVTENMPFHNSHSFDNKSMSNNAAPAYRNIVSVPPPLPANTYVQSNIPTTCNILPPVVQRPVLPADNIPDGFGNLQKLRFLPPPFVPSNNVDVHPFGTLMMVPPPPAYPQMPFPPPSQVPTSSFSVSAVPAVTLEPAKEKECLLSAFLQKFQKTEKKATKMGPTVVEFRHILKTGLSVSRRLLKCRENLSSLLHCETDEWNAEIQRMQKLKTELSEVCSILSIPQNLNFIQKKLRTIKKKREVKARLKREAILARQKEEQEREALHQEIDKWVDEIKEKNLKVKREIEMKKEVDKILSEVRRKIQEAKKCIEKLKVLEKLRAARQMNAQQKGLFVAPEHSLVFDQKLNAYRALLHKQVDIYEEEERTLRVMLEEEQEGQLEEEVQWRREKLKSLQKKKKVTIMQCLFGDTKDPSPEDPLFLFHQHQNAGNCSIKSLVQIRHHWDDHIAENGDPVPQQWIVPLPPSSPAWEAVCQS